MSLLPYGSLFPSLIAPSPFSSPFGLLDHFFDDQLQLQLRDHAGKLTVNPNGDFSYKVDASGFKPEELKVDVHGDEIVIKGDHRVKNEHEMVERSFVRRLRIPAHIQKDTIACDLDNRGHLTITGKKNALEQPEVRQIPINSQTAAAVTDKSGSKKEKNGGKK